MSIFRSGQVNVDLIQFDGSVDLKVRQLQNKFYLAIKQL